MLLRFRERNSLVLNPVVPKAAGAQRATLQLQQSCRHYGVMCPVWSGIKIILYSVFTYLLVTCARLIKSRTAGTSVFLLH